LALALGPKSLALALIPKALALALACVLGLGLGLGSQVLVNITALYLRLIGNIQRGNSHILLIYCRLLTDLVYSFIIRIEDEQCYKMM